MLSYKTMKKSGMQFMIDTFLHMWICSALVQATNQNAGRSYSDIQSTYYHKDGRYENRLPYSQDLLWRVVVNTRIRCVQKCQLDSNCPAVFYGGSNCRAYSNRMHDGVSTVHAPNMVYYEMKGKYGNLAEHKPATQSSTLQFESVSYAASLAVDGLRGGTWPELDNSCAHTLLGIQGWWRVDLLDTYYVTTIAILARSDILANEVSNAEIRVSQLDEGRYVVCGQTGSGWSDRFGSFHCPQPTIGRFVLITKTIKETLTLCEVEVYADGKP